MSRWMLTIVCALSVAAVAGAQDDDWDDLLAGLGDDAFDEAPAAVEVTETAVVEEDPFADMFEEAEAVPEAVEEAAEDVADAVEAVPEAVEAAAEEADPFAGDWGFDDAFAEASESAGEAAEDVAGAAEEAVEEVTETVEAVAEDAGEDPFADLFEDADADAVAEPAEEVVEEVVETVPGETVETVEATVAEGEDEDLFAGLFSEPDDEGWPVEEAATEETVEEEAVAVEEAFTQEVAAVEEAIAEAEAGMPEEAFATQEEGEAAATLIRNAKMGKGKDRGVQDAARVLPVEPVMKPQKQDKFSSEARKPLKPKTAVPDWDTPVSMDGSEVVAPVAKPAERAPAARKSRGAWDEPVVW